MNTELNALDWILIVTVGASAFFGFQAGLVRVVIGFAAVIVAIIVGFWFYQTPALFFAEYFKSDTVASALGFLVIFLAVIIGGGVLARLTAAVFRWAGLTWLDRLLGAVAGFVRGILVAVGIMTPLLSFAPDPMPKFLEQSKLLPYTIAFGHVLVTAAPPRIRNQFDVKSDVLKSMWKDEFNKVLPSTDKTKPTPPKKES